MNTFDLQCNDGAWKLTNSSNLEAKNIRSQMHLIVANGNDGQRDPQTYVLRKLNR